MGLLARIQCLPGRNCMPFGNAAPAAGTRGMLGDEDRVAAPWCLPAILVRPGRGKPAGYEIGRVRHDFRQATVVQIGAFPRTQVETGTKA